MINLIQFPGFSNDTLCKYLEQCIVACSPGFVGKNCEKACPYPTFGDSCQYHCFCAKEHCSIDRGCITLSGTKTKVTKMIMYIDKNCIFSYIHFVLGLGSVTNEQFIKNIVLPVIH